jgi:hypothetical protein
MAVNRVTTTRIVASAPCGSALSCGMKARTRRSRPGSTGSSVYVGYRTDWPASKVHSCAARFQYGYANMNTSEVVQPDILAKHSETFPRRAAQAGGTARSKTSTLPVRVFRTADGWRVEEGIHNRRSIQGAAVDARNSRDQRGQADVVRAATIVLEWREYLPDDCVKAMVASGWHFTV